MALFFSKFLGIGLAQPPLSQIKGGQYVLSSRVTTAYKVTLFDDKNKILEEQVPTADAKGLVNFVFAKVKDKNAKVKAVLQIVRKGVTVENSKINFDTNVEVTVPK